MTSIAELEHRLQLAQEEKAAAEMHYWYCDSKERHALEELTRTRIANGDM